MEDRILINGVWYVRETEKIDVEFTENEVTHFEGCIYETDEYIWEATRIINEIGVDYNYQPSEFAIEFSDKKTGKTEYWDSLDWMIGVCDNDPLALKSASERMNPKGLAEFKAFLNYLKSKHLLD